MYTASNHFRMYQKDHELITIFGLEFNYYIALATKDFWCKKKQHVKFMLKMHRKIVESNVKPK